jgi:hypothetical protein
MTEDRVVHLVAAATWVSYSRQDSSLSTGFLRVNRWQPASVRSRAKATPILLMP